MHQVHGAIEEGLILCDKLSRGQITKAFHSKLDFREYGYWFLGFLFYLSETFSLDRSGMESRFGTASFTPIHYEEDYPSNHSLTISLFRFFANFDVISNNAI